MLKHLSHLKDRVDSLKLKKRQPPCENMNVEAVLKVKRLRNCKRQFSYESPDEPVKDAMKSLEMNFFNIVVDAAVTSMQERFETLNQVEEKYGILLNFSHDFRMSDEDDSQLLENCLEIEKSLTF